MSRYTISFVTPCPPQQVNDYFASYLTSEGFEMKSENGENYWKKGMGLLTGPQFIKLNYQNNVFVMEAWIKFALLPGVYIGEMGIDGFFGCIPKSMLKTRVEHILAMLQAQPMPYGNPNMPPQAQPMSYGNPNVPPQVQPMPYGNLNMPPQVQPMPYGNPNVPPQVQNSQATQQNQNYQPVNQYNQVR